MTHLDLFSGIGGFALAARWAGIETIGFCEINPYAQQVLIKNFGAVMADTQGQRCDQTGTQQSAASNLPRLHRDISKLNGAEYCGVDLITGGFPCQPFSFAGKRRGKEDDRFLWPEMLRVIAEARPDWVLGENVAGIINMELDRVLSDLDGIGYTVQPFVVPAVAVDARHRRDRVWIVAHSEHNAGCAQFQHETGEWQSKGPTHKPMPESSGPNVADTAQQHGTQQRRKALEHRCGGEVASNARQPLLQGWEGESAQGTTQWEPEPNVGRVAHGIPKRVDRLKCLGNAIVPQVAFQILKAIKTVHESL